jgi:hypothetical protein
LKCSPKIRPVAKIEKPKFFYQQKVLEDLTVLAGNLQEKFLTGLKRIREQGA